MRERKKSKTNSSAAAATDDRAYQIYVFTYAYTMTGYESIGESKYTCFFLLSSFGFCEHSPFHSDDKVMREFQAKMPHWFKIYRRNR